MWGKIKRFFGSNKIVLELAAISKGVCDVFRRNKLAVFSAIAFFGLVDAAIKFIVINEFVGGGVVVGILSIVRVLFIPVLIYSILPKASFGLVDKDEDVGFITKIMRKFTLFSMFGRSFKTMVIIFGSVIIGFLGSNILSFFVPALYMLEDIESLNVWNMLFIAPVALFFIYVLIMGTAIALVKSLSDDSSLKHTVSYSIKRSLSSFASIAIMFLLYVAVMLSIGFVVGDFYYVISFLDCIMVAVVVFVLHTMSIDKSAMKL